MLRLLRERDLKQSLLLPESQTFRTCGDSESRRGLDEDRESRHDLARLRVSAFEVGKVVSSLKRMTRRYVA